MSSWEQWQAAQGAPPTKAPTAAQNNQNNLPSNNDNRGQAPSAPASPHGAPPTQFTHCGAGATASSPHPQHHQQHSSKPAGGGHDGMRILSADEVKKELSAMDPDTRQKTIEMGNKLKDLVQAAITIYTATPTISSSLFKEEILEKVGPMPVKEIDLPVHALKVLYGKLYGKEVPAEHEKPLAALSKVFSPRAQQQQQQGGGGLKQESKEKEPGAAPTADNIGVDSKEVSTAAMNTAKAAAVSTATGAAPGGGTAAAAIAGGGGKKLGVSREQYEKMVSKMKPEEREKHPKYDQVMKQYEQMDVSEKQRTQEAANKLRDYMRHSVQLYLGNPALSIESYRKRMKEKFGPVPNYQQWHLVTYTHLCTMYETINNVSHQTPHVKAALGALSQILPRAPTPPSITCTGTSTANNIAANNDQSRNANYALTGVNKPAPMMTGEPFRGGLMGKGPAAFVQQMREQETQQYLRQSDQYNSPEEEEEEEEMDINDMMMGNIGKEPDYDKLPSELNVSCNGQDGIFFVRTQTIRCLCQFCADTATALKVPYLILSVNEFERHCGMGQSKKWKYTIRVMNPPIMTLGQWMDENGFDIKYTKGQADDMKLRRAEKKRDREAAAVLRASGGGGGGGGGGGYNLNIGAKQQYAVQPIAGKNPPPPPPPPPAAPTAASIPAPPAVTVNRRKALLKSTQQKHTGDEGGLDGGDGSRPGSGAGSGGAGGGLGGRVQRQRKQPTWMKQTLDPNAVLGGKSMIPRDINDIDEDNDEVPVLRGAGQLHSNSAPRTRPASGHNDVGPSAKRARLDPDALLEAEIDAALSRGLQPEVRGWRVDDSNQLNVTVHLGGVVFSGVLPARVPREASSPDIYAAVLRQNERAAAAAAAGPPSAVVPRPPLPQQQQRNVAAAAAPLYNNINAGGAGGSYDDDMDDLPPVPPTAVRTLSTALGTVNDHAAALVAPGSGNVTAAAAAAVAASVPMGGAAAVVIESAVKRAVKKEIRMDERRAEAASEYDRLLVEGPPPGSKCAMCHLEEVDTVPRGSRDPSTGKSHIGLGGLILVRTSAVTNAWVHDQCARWSPDVYDPTGEGILEGIAVAVRRGRMLRCKTCGQKGATLGCMKKTCKCSYHLPCAREHGCLLNMEPYAVACPEHVDQLPDGLSQILGFKRVKRGRSESAQPGLAAPPAASQMLVPGGQIPSTGGGGTGGGTGGAHGGGGDIDNFGGYQIPDPLNALRALASSHMNDHPSSGH